MFRGWWGGSRSPIWGNANTLFLNAFFLLYAPINSSTQCNHVPRFCRNLFFRVSSLTLMGAKLIFVMEGEAPKLKSETMCKRTETRYRGFKKSSGRSTNRGRFNAVLKEVGLFFAFSRAKSCNYELPYLHYLHLLLSLLFSVCRHVGLPGCALGDSCRGGRGHVCLPGLSGSSGWLHHQWWGCLFIWSPDSLQELQYEQQSMFEGVHFTIQRDVSPKLPELIKDHNQSHIYWSGICFWLVLSLR